MWIAMQNQFECNSISFRKSCSESFAKSSNRHTCFICSISYTIWKNLPINFISLFLALKIIMIIFEWNASSQNDWTYNALLTFVTINCFFYIWRRILLMRTKWWKNTWVYFPPCNSSYVWNHFITSKITEFKIIETCLLPCCVFIFSFVYCILSPVSRYVM